MKRKEVAVRSAIAGLLALGAASLGTQVLAADVATEKCAGIVKAGKNDCGTTKLSCHGSLKVDNGGDARIEVPKGPCACTAGASRGSLRRAHRRTSARGSRVVGSRLSGVAWREHDDGHADEGEGDAQPIP
jgi:uncharacterized membrane protein